MKQKLADYSETSKSGEAIEFATFALAAGLAVVSIIQFAFFVG